MPRAHLDVTVRHARLREAKPVLLMLCCAAALAGAGALGEVGVGHVLREATMQGLNGPSRKLSEFRGKSLIINVWASWCGPCRVEMASLERLAWRDRVHPLTIIGVSTDDDADAAKAALVRANATITHFIDSKLQLEIMLGATRLPLTVLVDAHGRVLNKIYGARAWDSPESQRLIDATFGATPSAPLCNSQVCAEEIK